MSPVTSAILITPVAAVNAVLVILSSPIVTVVVNATLPASFDRVNELFAVKVFSYVLPVLFEVLLAVQCSKESVTLNLSILLAKISLCNLVINTSN